MLENPTSIIADGDDWKEKTIDGGYWTVPYRHPPLNSFTDRDIWAYHPAEAKALIARQLIHANEVEDMSEIEWGRPTSTEHGVDMGEAPQKSAESGDGPYPAIIGVVDALREKATGRVNGDKLTTDITMYEDGDFTASVTHSRQKDGDHVTKEWAYAHFSGRAWYEKRVRSEHEIPEQAQTTERTVFSLDDGAKADEG